MIEFFIKLGLSLRKSVVSRNFKTKDTGCVFCGS